MLMMPNLMLSLRSWVIFFGLVYVFKGVQSLRASRKVIHERRLPNNLWKRTDHLGSTEKQTMLIPFRFGLKQSNLHNLYDELMKVSSPDSPSYSQHWNEEKIIDFFAPSHQTTHEVLQWIKSEAKGIEKVELSKSRTWLNVHMTLDQAEKLLETKFHKYVHAEDEMHHIGMINNSIFPVQLPQLNHNVVIFGSAQTLACEYYKIPEHLVSHIDIVLPSVHFDTVPVAHKYTSYPSQPHRNPSDVHHHSKRSAYPGPRNDIFSAPAIKPVAGAARHIGNPSSGNIPKYSILSHHEKLGEIGRGVQNCGSVTTLDCLKALYKFGSYKMKVPHNNSLAIVEFTPQSVIYTDMDKFFSKFSPRVKGSRPQLVSIDGGVLDQETQEFGLNGESNLDLQYSMPFVHPLNVSLYQIGDTDTGGSFNNFLDALDSSYCSGALDPLQDGIYPNPRGYKKRDCGTVKPANVISTSYGMNEADATPKYLTRQCDEYGKLGLMGVTFVFSSGDTGVAGNRGICLNRDGTQSADGPMFNPSFPGTCPYVTSIGATQLPAGKSINDSEAACYTRIHSGGGFSNVFALPQYQSKHIKKYFETQTPPYDLRTFNNSRNTRGYPDISANGANFVVSVMNRYTLVYGTSASAPVVGSILTMINDARIAIGKGPIGFINPAIYTKRFIGGFNDITNGSNPGCGTEGFSAVPGWDPVTGLGTPDFTKLLPLFRKLP